MGYRVNEITVTIDLYVEFAGTHSVTFSYKPGADDPLAQLAVAKNDELLLAAARREMPDIGLA